MTGNHLITWSTLVASINEFLEAFIILNTREGIAFNYEIFYSKTNI